MSNVTPTMLLITTDWQSQKSFRLMPIKEECPYTEGIYDPDSKVLVLMSKVKKESLHMLPRLDDSGDPTMLKTARKNGKQYKEQRTVLNTFQEYYISEKEEILNVIKMIAVNAAEFPVETIMTPSLITVEEKKIELIKP